ncbi:MAG: hypothetical protein M1814_002414 [Vezdaea aestivalis]|nr:MAG: hypothetical protein M1814_002414 [Vezdaea aestivalis]
MPFHLTAASRVTKPGIRRSPLKSKRAAPQKDKNREAFLSRGLGGCIAEDDSMNCETTTTLVGVERWQNSSSDLLQAMRTTDDCMFSALPDRASGMNSTQISSVLRTRRSLPPVVSKARLRALFRSATALERQIFQQGGRIRKISIPMTSAPGGTEEVYVLSEVWTERVLDAVGLDGRLKEKFQVWLGEHPLSSKVEHSFFNLEEATKLVQAGLVTVPGRYPQVHSAGISGVKTLSTAGSSAASGSVEATGGIGAIHEVGGSTGRKMQYDMFATDNATIPLLEEAYLGKDELNLTLPGLGTYVRILDEALKQVKTLLSESPHHQCPISHLEERWEGGTPPDSQSSRSRKTRGEFSSLLPGQTRKWRHHYGLSFDWIICESIGRGFIELFDTKSIGIGVRRIT